MEYNKPEVPKSYGMQQARSAEIVWNAIGPEGRNCIAGGVSRREKVYKKPKP
jgi:hypothetical protein